MRHAIAFLSLVLVPSFLHAQQKLPSYEQWQTACAKLPSNRQLIKDKKEKIDQKLLPLPTFADFEVALDGFLKITREGPLAEAKNWIGNPPNAKDFFDTTRTWFGDKKVSFEPFAAKLVLPKDAEAIVMGDLHGDIRSLLKTLGELNERRILDGFKLRDEKYYFLFLGDFTDRGLYGVEVLYTLFRLKMANPERIHFARGNHEDFTIVSRYGFLAELVDKYGQNANITKLLRAFDLLPVVIYLGNETDFLQMNHGGMEPGYDPKGLLSSTGSLRFQLLGELKQKAYDKRHSGWLGDDPAVRTIADQFLRDFTPESPTSPRTLGFMWNDFTVFADEPALDFSRSLVFGAKPTRHILTSASTEKIRVRAVIRAHQHEAKLNPLMSRLVASDGVFRHWHEKETTADKDKTVQEIRVALRPEETRAIPEGSVWTFNVAPDSGYGMGCGFDFTTIGIIKPAPEFKDWRITVVRINVF